VAGRAAGGDSGPGRIAGVLGVLRIPDFRRYFIGQTISQFGDRLVPVALAFAVLGRFHSVTDLSIVLACESVAQLVFFLAGGVIADRMSRRHLMLWSDAAQLAATAVLGVLFVAGHPPLAVIAVAAAVQGVASAMFLPASSGILPALVSRDQLQQANALSHVAGAATGIAGPAIAGVLVATVGPGWAIIADSVTFVASVASLARMQVNHIPRSTRAPWWTDLRDGWDAFRERTWVWAVTLGASLFNFSFAIYIVLGPVTSLRYYHGASTWAAISATSAAGSLLGGVAATRLKPGHPFRVALPAAGLFVLTPLALAAGLPTAAVAAIAAAGGAGLIVFGSIYETAIQQNIPAEALSRVSSYDWLGSSLAFPLGLALAGTLITTLGIRPALLLIAAISASSIIGLLATPSLRNLTNPVAD
jgi:MFS family permease